MTKNLPVIALEALDASRCGLRVEFQKTGDRFSHKLFTVSGKSVQLLLESVEGTPEEIAPPSPPFTELHQQQDLLFLTGATTLGHWSMSVQTVDNRLLFDVACRVQAEANGLDSSIGLNNTHGLGSTYHTRTPNPTLESKNATITQPQKNTLHITPPPPNAPLPQTLQWQYILKQYALK